MRFLTLPRTKEGINYLLEDLSNSVRWLANDGKIDMATELRFEKCVRDMYQAYYEAMQPEAAMQDSWKTALAAYLHFINPEYRNKGADEIKQELGDINKETFIKAVVDMHHLIALASTNAYLDKDEQDKLSIYEYKNKIMSREDVNKVLYWFDFEELVLGTGNFSEDQAYDIKDILRSYCENDNCTDTPLNELEADKVKKYTEDIERLETILTEEEYRKDYIDKALDQIKTERDVFNYFRNRRDDLLKAINSSNAYIIGEIKAYEAKNNSEAHVDFGRYYDINDKLVKGKDFDDHELCMAFDKECKNFKEDDYSTLADWLKALNLKFPSKEREKQSKRRVENKLFLTVENTLLGHDIELTEKQKLILPGKLLLYFNWMQKRLENFDMTKEKSEEVEERLNTNSKVISVFEELAESGEINVSGELNASFEKFKISAEELKKKLGNKNDIPVKEEAEKPQEAMKAEPEQADQKAEPEQAAKKVEMDMEAQKKKYVESVDKFYNELIRKLTPITYQYLADDHGFKKEQEILEANKEAIDILLKDETFEKLVSKDKKKDWKELQKDVRWKTYIRMDRYKYHTEDVNDAMDAFKAIMNEKVSSGHKAQFQAIRDAVEGYVAIGYGNESAASLYKACRDYLNCHTSDGISNDIGGQHSDVGRLRKQAVVKLLDVMESKAAEMLHYDNKEDEPAYPEFKAAVASYEADYKNKHNGQDCPKLNITELKRSLARNSHAREDQTIQNADKRITNKAYAELEAKKKEYAAAKKADNAARQAAR